MTYATDKLTDLTAEHLRDILHYDPETGWFTWNHTFGHRIAGRRAGCLWRGSGYRTITIWRRCYREHRLAWLYMTGKWPENQIDHKNNIRDDNRFENLREATWAMNVHNRKTAQVNNRIGVHGVYLTKLGNFTAHIRVNKKKIHLGTFSNAGAASAAYMAAKLKYHPAFIPGSSPNKSAGANHEQ